MLSSLVTAGLFLSTAVLGAAVPPNARPFSEMLAKRQASSTSNNLTVDLGYEVYEGFTNTTTGLNIFRGIRFAAPPLGDLRWQAPRTPALNRSSVISANAYGPTCPQSPNSNNGARPAVSPTAYGSEDCLFLNVYAPNNATNLPVLVWIHGGGYGAGNGRQDLSSIIHTNGNSFVGVSIQYRLGAFGFLSSDEVFRFGRVNAGLLDQYFALQWVQAYIEIFGGDPTQVTISGESAGGGSVMLLDLAYGGTIGDSLFKGTIAASPYLPTQYGYKDWQPSQSYYAFATAAGCPPVTAYGNGTTTILQCLRSKDSRTLQTASFQISASGVFGTWGFIPVTDGTFVQQLPSQQLLQHQVNGQRALIGNNANEGVFSPSGIDTIEELVDYLHLVFPLFTTNDIAKVLLYYPSSNATDSPDALRFATTGDMGPTAVNQSLLATGQQQRADNIYAETTFVCPSYWMAEAYSSAGKSSYKYQYSVPPATHGADVAGYFGPASPAQGPDFARAFMTIWGNFITQGNPSIPAAVAKGASSANANAANAASDWPPFSIYAPYQINLNQTGGTLTTVPNGAVNITYAIGPGLMNDFSSVNAYTWEGGRGTRCDFWRSVSAIVPE